jgi:ABC-type branched-subunit amino acid transport system ATPase component
MTARRGELRRRAGHRRRVPQRSSGEIVGLIGPNGAGKTSLVDAWCGFVAHDGTVEVNRHGVTGRPPHRRAQAGLARTWRTVELIDDLTLAQE